MDVVIGASRDSALAVSLLNTVTVEKAKHVRKYDFQAHSFIFIFTYLYSSSVTVLPLTAATQAT